MGKWILNVNFLNNFLADKMAKGRLRSIKSWELMAIHLGV